MLARHKVQVVNNPNNTPLHNLKNAKRVQEIVGMYLFYACSVDSTMLLVLRFILSNQARSTKQTMEKVVKFLNYTVSNPNVIVWFCASSIILHIESDES